MLIKVKELYQWDLDVIVEITPDEGVTIDEVHFYNPYGNVAYVMPITITDTSVIVNIPNILLQYTHDVHMYVVKSDQTTSDQVFTVTAKQKPADYVYTETEVKSYENLEKRIKALEENTTGVSDEQIEEAVKKYLAEKSIAKIGNITLLASEWVGEDNLYSQVVEIDGVTENSQVDLTPSVEQLAVFYEKDLTFVTENENGVVTVYAIGQKPQNDYTMQVTITEVEYE